MSLNQLIADHRKPWLNIRVNNINIDESLGATTVDSLTVTNGLSVGGNVTIVNSITGVNGITSTDNIETPSVQLSGGAILNTYEEYDVIGNITGTFVLNPITVTARFTRIGRIVTMAIPGFTITTVNQNGAGGFIQLDVAVPVSLAPLEKFAYPVVIQDVTGADKLSDISYAFGSNVFIFEDVPNSPAFPAGGSNNMVFDRQTLTWSY